MKNITKQFLFLTMLTGILSFVSCNNDDKTSDSALEVIKGVVGTTTLDTPLQKVQTITEPKSSRDGGIETITYTYTINLNKAQSVPVFVSVKQVSGSANSDDFTFDSDLYIPARATSVTGTVTINGDDAIEGDEDFTLQIADERIANGTLEPVTVKFILKNYLSPDLEFIFGYNQSLAIPGTSGLTLYNVSAGPNNPYDMDYFVLDSQFNDTGMYEAASAAEPEKLIISDSMTNPDNSPNASYLADGTYYIFYSLYSDATLSTIQDFTPVDVPTTVDYLRRGGIAPGTFVQEADFVPTTKAAPGDTNFVISFTKLAGVYTLNNSIPQVIASGRSSIKEKLNVAVANARRNHKK